VTPASVTRLNWVGLAAGPVAWGLSTQANYAAAPWLCGSSFWAAIIAAVLIGIALVGGALSLHSFRSAPRSDAQADGRPHIFLAGLGALLSGLFALAVLMQGAAGLILNGCER
jgi:hypothetical protein